MGPKNIARERWKWSIQRNRRSLVLGTSASVSESLAIAALSVGPCWAAVSSKKIIWERVAPWEAASRGAKANREKPLRRFSHRKSSSLPSRLRVRRSVMSCVEKRKG